MDGFVPADQEIRTRIRTELDRNFLVEAGAGTGKTTVMVDRVAEILRTGYAGIDEIIVITFTEKAAAELAGRIRDRLDGALGESREPAERRRLEEALAGLPRARVETIHAFAASLLRERPVEAGLDPGFEVLDELGADLGFDDAFRRWLGEQLDGRPEELRRALNRGLDLQDVREMAGLVHGYRDLLPLAAEEAPRPDVDGFLAELTSQAAELDDLLLRCKDPDNDAGAGQIRAIRRLLDDCQAVRGDADNLERCLLHASKIAAKGNQKNWPDKQTHQRQKELCHEIGEGLEALRLALRAEAVAGLLPLIAAFVRGYASERRAAGKAEFEDLLIWVRDLLRDTVEVRRYFQGRFRCVLVDEFQDTDPLQVEIVLYLCARGQDAADWRDLRPSAGALFVVGDPKQSIYRFRRADIAIYEWVKQHILLGQDCAINQNFRSLDRVIGWVNRVFRQIIVPVDGLQASYIDLAPLPPAMTLPRSPVVLLRPAGAATKAAEVRAAEAAALARAIREAVAGGETWTVRDPATGGMRPAHWRDVAVLLPSRTDIDIYEDALAAAEIPYRHEGGKAFYQRQEVRELIACLRAVDDPGDRLSLVAALRSAAFGCSDEEIFLATCAAPESVLDYRRPPATMPTAVAEALAVLAELHHDRRERPLPALVQRILDATGLVDYALTLPQGDQAAANLFKMIDQARAFAAAHSGGLRAFVRWLDSTSAGRAEESDAAVAESGDDVVRLLTIHAAKGLEFPIVALANLNGGSARHPKVIADREARRLQLRLGTQSGGYFQTPGYELAAQREAMHDAAEHDRLLYVAATRARDHLIIPTLPDGAKPDGMLARLLERLPAVSPEAHGSDIDDCHVCDAAQLGRPLDGVRAQAVDTGAGQAQVEAALRQRAAWLEARGSLLSEAGCGLRTVNASGVEAWDRDEARDEVDAGWREPGLSARALGVAFHDTMQAIDLETGADLETIAAARAAESGISAAAGEIIALARRCLATPSLARARRAGRYRREVAYAVGLPDGGLAEGRMDLLFREDDGLVIVDYKTDRVGGAEIDRRLAVYRNQAAVYAFAAAQASGLPVKEVVFVFARPGLERAIPASADLLTHGQHLAMGHADYIDEAVNERAAGARNAALPLTPESSRTPSNVSHRTAG